MTKMEKIKSWAREHQLEIVAVAGTVVAVGVSVLLADASLKEEQKRVEAYNAWVDDMNQWLNDEIKKGNYVYQLADGSYLTVKSDGVQEIVIK